MARENPDGTREIIRLNEFILRGENRWRGWTCNSGIVSLRIAGDGAVYRAVCGVGGCIGEIGRDIRLPEGSVVCDRDACSCVADILISKARWQ